MSLGIVGIANVAAVKAPADPGMWSFGPATLPEWITLFLTLLGIGAGFGILHVVRELRDRIPPSPVPNEKEFLKTIRADVKEYTETTTSVLLDKLQTNPDSMETLRTQLRSLRNDLSGVLEYIDRMKLIAPGYFPSAEISSAYGKWAGAARALYRQVEDIHQELTFPLVSEPVVRHRENYMLGQYLVEKEVMLRQLERIKAAAIKLDGLAAKKLKKGSHKSAHDHGHEDEDEHDHH